jgi:hypothetical protein
VRRWPAPALLLIAAGAIARLTALGLAWGKPLEPDASEYLLLARRYSFAHPWSASYREPLWRAMVKIATGPFGYSANSLRVFTALVSIATLPVAWILLQRLGLGRRVSLIALGLLALSLQLVREAPRGLREDTVLLVFLFVAIPLLARDRSRRAGIAAGVAIGLLSVIRWEVASLAIIVCAAFALLRRGPVLAPVVGAVLLVALSGPWLVANAHRHNGDLLYNTKVHATYYWKHSQPPSVLRRYSSPPGVDPPVHLSWSQYYLDVLGPAQTVKLAAEGYPRIAAKLVAAQVLPRQAGTAALGTNQHRGAWLLVSALGALLALGAAVAAGFRVRRHPGRSTALTALVLLAVLIAPYAPIAASAELRVLLYALPLLAVAGAIAIDACVPALTAARRSRSAPSRPGGRPAQASSR